MGTQAVSNLRMNCMGSKYTGVLTYACARLDQCKSIRPRQSIRPVSSLLPAIRLPRADAALHQRRTAIQKNGLHYHPAQTQPRCRLCSKGNRVPVIPSRSNKVLCYSSSYNMIFHFHFFHNLPLCEMTSNIRSMWSRPA